jgi:hypothetical protein
MSRETNDLLRQIVNGKYDHAAAASAPIANKEANDALRQIVFGTNPEGEK